MSKIMLVDDNEVIIDLYERTLKEVAPELNIVKAYVSLAKHIASKG